MNDRLVLAIDTSFGPVNAALATCEGEVIAGFEMNNPPGTQAETLPPLVSELFGVAGANFDRLSRVAVTVGPGAFTGVRVGLAFAKGLRLATGAVVLGFTTLECLGAQAAAANPGCSVVVAIDAKRGEVYVQVFDSALASMTEAALLPLNTAEELVRRVLKGPSVVTGSGAGLLSLALHGQPKIEFIPRIDAILLARRAAGADPARYPATAAYLRAPDAKLPS